MAAEDRMEDGADGARASFVETVGLIGQAEGMPRIAGRVFGLLLHDGRAYAFGELADVLQVSRGSVSGAVRLLEARDLVRRTTMPGERGDFFRLADAPFTGLLEGAHRRVARARDDIAAHLPDLADGPRARAEDYVAFYGALASALDDARARLSDHEDAGSAPATEDAR